MSPFEFVLWVLMTAIDVGDPLPVRVVQVRLALAYAKAKVQERFPK